MIDASIQLMTAEALRDLDARHKFARRAVARGVDAGSRELAEYIIREHYEGKFKPWFARRTEVMKKSIRRSARRYPSTRRSLITDRLIQARRYGPALERGGEYTQFVKQYTRKPRGASRSFIVKSHLRRRREEARHMFALSWPANAKMLEFKVNEALDVFFATGTVPTVAELTRFTSR